MNMAEVKHVALRGGKMTKGGKTQGPRRHNC